MSTECTCNAANPRVIAESASSNTLYRVRASAHRDIAFQSEKSIGNKFSSVRSLQCKMSSSEESALKIQAQNSVANVYKTVSTQIRSSECLQYLGSLGRGRGWRIVCGR